jgi:hypothetical protein
MDSAEKRWRGPGSAAPERFDSKGPQELLLGAVSCVLYTTGEAL